MVIDVVRDILGPFLLVLHKQIVEIVEFRELLKESHKLLVGTILFDVLAMLEPQGVGIVDQLREFF